MPSPFPISIKEFLVTILEVALFSTTSLPTMAESFQTHPDVIEILIVHDISTQKASQLAETFVALAPKFDLIIVVGPCCDSSNTITPENVAAAEGDMASSIAQLENITCRVVYLPGENDPPNTLMEQLHLTPNSVNIYARRLPLRTGLFITGFTETGENLDTNKVPDDFDRSAESDDELENVEVKSGISSVKAITEILNGEDQSESIDSGIFLLNYKFIHTLNHFLFHMGEEIAASKVNLVIVAPKTEDALRLPSTFGKLQIVVPKSLREGGNYCTVRLKKTEDNSWQPVLVEHHVL